MALKANPVFSNQTPFYQNVPTEVNPTQGAGYAPATNATNLLVQQALQRLGIGSAGNLQAPMYASPYAGRASSLSDALMGMGARDVASTPYTGGRSAQVTGQELGTIGDPLQRALTMAEPARRSQLLQLLLQAYGLDAGIFGGYTRGETTARQIDTAAARERGGALGQIPFVGGVLAGVGA